MNYLITGGAGFIGSHIIEKLSEKTEDKIFVIDNLYSGKKENIPNLPNIHFYQGDINDDKILQDIFSKKIDYVIHLAAIASVPYSIQKPTETHKTNFDGSLKIIEYSAKNNVKKILFSSTAAIYGNENKLPLKENFCAKPLSPYAADKLAVENYLKIFSQNYNLKFTIFRLFNVYGERQNPSSFYSGVITIFLEQIKKYGSNSNVKIKIFGDGKQTRDFVYVKDVAEIFIKSIENSKTDNQIFNLGSGKNYSILQLIQILKKHFTLFPPIEFLPPREGDIKHSYADISKLKKLHLSPKTDFEQGLFFLINSIKR